MFKINYCKSVEQTKEFPEWLQYATKGFVKQGQNCRIVDIVLNKPSDIKWYTIGKYLFDKIILPCSFGWLSIEGTFSSKQLIVWAKNLVSQIEEKNAKMFSFNYATYLQPHPMKQDKKIANVNWLSFSSTESLPLDQNVINIISSTDVIGCEIILASPLLTVDINKNKMVTQLNRETMFKYMGSWVVPIENYYGYIIGITKGQPSYNVFSQESILKCQLEQELLSIRKK